MLTVTGAELQEAVQADKDLESELLRLVIVNWQPGAGPGARKELFLPWSFSLRFWCPGAKEGVGGRRFPASSFSAPCMREPEKEINTCNKTKALRL